MCAGAEDFQFTADDRAIIDQALHDVPQPGVPTMNLLDNEPTPGADIADATIAALVSFAIILALLVAFFG